MLFAKLLQIHECVMDSMGLSYGCVHVYLGRAFLLNVRVIPVPLHSLPFVECPRMLD